MTAKEAELIASMYSLLGKYQDLVDKLYPLPVEMAAYFGPDVPQPSLEKLRSWHERLLESDQMHSEIILAFEVLRQSLGLENKGRA